MLTLWTLALFLGLLAFRDTCLSTPYRQRQLLQGFLMPHAAPSPKECEDIQRGKPVAWILPTEVKQEISLLGVVRIDVPEDFFGRMAAREGLNVETSAAPSKGRFSAAPTLEDVQGLRLPPGDLGELSKGVSAGCKVKASHALALPFGDLDPRSPDFEDCGNGLMREVLVNYVKRYLRRGNGALITYEDKAEPVPLADAFRSLTETPPHLPDPVPEIYRFFGNFPNRRLNHAHNALYWKMEHFDREKTRPVLSLNHLVFHRQPDIPEEMVIVSKQLYATHYYEAALGVTRIWDAPRSGAPALYLVHFNRSRIDLLRDIPRFLARSIHRGARDMLQERMRRLKCGMEEAYRRDGA